jgi:sodium-dependent dicarboxylate transporter 2/3/5
VTVPARPLPRARLAFLVLGPFAAVAVLMLIWWLSEALPIHVTACVPLVAYPLLGIFGGGLAEDARRAALPYVHPYIFLFLGGMSIAAAMQQWGLHRRVALAIMRAIGTQPARLLFGFLAATASVSLWISNTATATMMLPIGIAMIAQLESIGGGRRLEHYGAAIMLAIAYGANVGGIGTKIGTGTNTTFVAFLSQRGVEISFLEYMVVGLPFVLLFLPCVWWVLWRLGRSDAPAGDAGREAMQAEWARLGPMQAGEKVVLGMFLLAGCLWIAAPGLTGLLRSCWPAWTLTSAHVEAAIAMGTAGVLLAWRVRGRAALELGSLALVSWGTLVFMGGSLAMASGIEASGLSSWLAGQLTGLRELAPFAQVLIASSATVAISAFASNIAALSVMLNVLVGSVAPLYLNTTLFAATVAASCDFALPVGTPPNAIVFGSGYLTIGRMARTGVALDAAGAVLAAAWCYLAVGWVL